MWKRFALFFSLLLLASSLARSQPTPLTESLPEASDEPSLTLEQSLDQLDLIWNQLESEGMTFSESSLALKTALESAQSRSKELLSRLESSETQARALSFSLAQASESLKSSASSLQEANNASMLSNAESSLWKIVGIASISALVGDLSFGSKAIIPCAVSGAIVISIVVFKDFIPFFRKSN